MNLPVGRTGCLHNTEFVREVPPSEPGFAPIQWWRCTKCGSMFTEQHPTVMFTPTDLENDE